MITSTDCVLFTLHENTLKVLLIKREHEPFKGMWTLCGGFIQPEQDGSDLDSANRILLKKTGIQVNYLEQLKTFASAKRDPRDWSISIAWYALVNHMVFDSSVVLQHTNQWQLFDVDNLPDMGFDHREIVDCAVQRLRNKSLYSSLVGYLLNKEFTLPELHQAYEQVLKEPVDNSVFRRKLKEFDFLENTGKKRKIGASCPPSLYRMKEGLTIMNKVIK